MRTNYVKSLKVFHLFSWKRFLTSKIVQCCSKSALRPSSATLLCASLPTYKVAIEGDKKIEVPDPACLTHSYLIKNAAISAIDAATTLLTQTACRLLELEEQYSVALKELISLLEHHMKVLGNEGLEVQVWDNLLCVRHKVSEIRLQKMETEGMFSSTVRMLESAAEVAHSAGSEYAGIAASERLFSAKSQVNHAQQKSREMEYKLNQVEVKNIEVTAKHAKKEQEKMEKLQREEEAKSKESEEQGQSDKDMGANNKIDRQHQKNFDDINANKYEMGDKWTDIDTNNKTSDNLLQDFETIDSSNQKKSENVKNMDDLEIIVNKSGEKLQGSAGEDWSVRDFDVLLDEERQKEEKYKVGK